MYKITIKNAGDTSSKSFRTKQQALDVFFQLLENMSADFGLPTITTTKDGTYQAVLGSTTITITQ